VGVNGSFVFPTALASGTTFTVTIKTQPAVRHEICTVTNESGAIVATNISNVSINCSTVLGFVYAFDPTERLTIAVPGPTNVQKEELDRRLVDHAGNPEDVVP
jgi:hypothetical protein